MFLAFGDSLAILGMFCLFLLGTGTLLVLIWRAASRRKFSVREGIAGALAAAVIFLLGTRLLGDIEYNPGDVTIDKIAGTYTRGDRVLVMNPDGTYTAQNLKGYNPSGTWSHRDWDLTFGGGEIPRTGKTAPRWILRNGKPEILPHYTGPDGSDGIALKKVE